MAGKNRLLAKLLSSSSDGTVVPDSDILSTNVSKTLTSAVGIQTYANIDLLPSSAETGEKALVLSTNRLYIYNNGWYNIAIINNFNPEWITQPSSSYTLNTDGTSTTITVLASDSDDVPITYTAVTNSGFDSIATITHDSDKHNVWTVTPIDSDNGTGTAGSGTVTFKASDGVNLVQAVSSFDISFTVTNSNYTSTLVYADSDSNDNQVDATSNHTITENGSPGSISSSFSPFHPGGYSLILDGNGDYVDTGFSTTAGTGDFTFECWYKTTTGGVILGKYTSGSSMFAFIISSVNGFMASHTATGAEVGGNIDRRDGQWHYGVWERHNGTFNYYTDNNLDGTLSNTENDASAGNHIIGRHGNAAVDYFNGELRDIRLTLGTARYGGSAPGANPTAPGTATGSEAILAFTGLPYKKDISSNNRTLTMYGNSHLTRTGPFDYGTYSKTDHLGSVTFDGTDDYLSVNDSTELDFGSGDWTIEHWFYKTGSFKDWDALWGKYASNAGYWLHVNSTGKILLGTSNNNYVTSTQSLSLRTWHHIATVRHNGTIKVYIDGVASSISMSYGSNNDNNTPLLIGNINGFSRYTQGFISDFRVVKGTAVYTSNFTPPAQPLTAISGTSLLTCTNKHFLWDQSGSYAIWPWTAVTVESFAKFANEDSIKFNGTLNSYVMIGSPYETNYKPLKWLNDDELGPGTFEAWIYQTAQAAGSTDYTMPSILGWGGTYLNFGVNSSQLRFYYWTGSQNVVNPSGATISLNTWHHVAFSNDSSNNLRIFLDGALVHTISSFPGVAYASASNGEYIYLGTESQNTSSRFTGYIYNARITDGLARYTANFTPPTSKLTG